LEKIKVEGIPLPDLEDPIEEAMVVVEIQQEGKRIVSRNLGAGMVDKVTILETVKDLILENNSILKRTSHTRGLIS
jgi:hypothetical protein|tara:strand:- start:6018 stop:6245 length:228 start_codon:yes stop_codon:yes gene_type:complete